MLVLTREMIYDYVIELGFMFALILKGLIPCLVLVSVPGYLFSPAVPILP